MKIALGLSLAANVALLVVVLLTGGGGSTAASDPSRSPSALCERLPGDLDFFVEGLEKGNDPFYSPLVVRFLELVLLQCVPERSAEIARAMPALREHLLKLVGANVSADSKRAAHDGALRIFRELRALFGTRT